MKQIITIILIMLFSSTIFGQKDNIVKISQQPFESTLEGKLFWAKNLSLKQDNDLLKFLPTFRDDNHQVISFGQSMDENWVMFRLQNNAKSSIDLVLSLYQAFVSRADLYLFRDSVLVQKSLQNDKIKPENRILSDVYFNFPFQAAPKSTYYIFLRLKANPENGTVKALLTLADNKTYVKNSRNSHLNFGIFAGVLIFSIIAAFILFANSPKGIYIHYAGFITTILLAYLANYDYLTDWLNFQNVSIIRFYHSMMLIGGFFQVRFVTQFLSLESFLPKYFRSIFKILELLFILTGVSNLIFPVGELVPYVSRTSLIILGVFLFVVSIWSFTRKEKMAKLYLLAMSPGILLVVYMLSASLGIIPLFRQAYYCLFIISVYEIIVFGCGLVYQFNKEKVDIERKLLEERQQIAHKIITAQERERQRVAQDLHDDLGSTLSILKHQLAESNEINQFRLENEIDMADKAVNDLRLIAHNLTPTLFLEKGLIVALREFISLNSIKPKINFIHSGNAKPLSWETELSIFRISKELINNAIKHAKATNIEFQIIYFDKFLYLSIEDNGTGFINKPSESAGIGLKNIILRVEYLHGKMSQESSEKGTLISIEIPYVTNHKSD